VERAQLVAIAGLELRLRGWERGAERIVDEIEDEPRSGASEALRVQAPEALDAALEDAAPALRIDGRVVCRRRVPTAREIRGYLDAAEA